jgi:hypothetical protein
MDVGRALDQIAEIHQQIAKGEIYRGYRPVPVAASGLIGIAGAWIEPHIVAESPATFVLYWTSLGAIAALVGFSEILHNYLVHDDPTLRRRTRRVLGQFLPSLLAGVAVAAALLHGSGSLVAIVPGLWAVFFGLGILASGPYLPRASGVIALLYFGAGVWLLMSAHTLNGWQVGGVFGGGQLLAALVLWREP